MVVPRDMHIALVAVTNAVVQYNNLPSHCARQLMQLVESMAELPSYKPCNACCQRTGGEGQTRCIKHLFSVKRWLVL